MMLVFYYGHINKEEIPRMNHKSNKKKFRKRNITLGEIMDRNSMSGGPTTNPKEPCNEAMEEPMQPEAKEEGQAFNDAEQREEGLETHSKDSHENQEQGYNILRFVSPIKGFNIPKNGDGGEDADPYDFTSSRSGWGVISVFDGMGGAGAREYVHNETNERHTSAYWASRFVRSSVEELIKELDTKDDEKEPSCYIEGLLHQRITEKLDKEIVHFSTDSRVKSKLIRKLPTTIAMCLYEIKDSKVHIKTYWAGDSRIYMFDVESMSFLTIDDAEAPDNDPFSPANMDLVMNNAISQDLPFHINKYEKDITLNPEKPFVLLACTDGCFGYFKNPIEFEYMVRSGLKDSDDWDEWSDNMKNAIIQNGKHDDLSLVGIALGVESTSFTDFKQKMQKRLDEPIFNDYYKWKRESQLEQSDLLMKVDQPTKEISQMLKDRDSLKVRKIEFEDSACKIKEILNGITTTQNSVKEEILEKVRSLDEYSNKLSSIESEIEEKSREITTLKTELEELQLRLQKENITWYKKYKGQNPFDVEPLTKI